VSGCEVSVVIPTRDRWPLLKQTLRGALAQEGVAHEVIVVDDGSADETPVRLGEVGDRRLRLVRHERSRGVSAARNSGIAEARGEWLAFLDDDDLWSPHKLRVQVDAAHSREATFSYVAAVVLDERGMPVEVLPAPDAEDPVELVLPRNVIPASGSNVLASAAAVREAGGFDEGLSHFEDWDLWLRLAQTGPAAACTDVLMAYVQHEGSMMLSDKRGLVTQFERLAEKHRDLAAGRDARFDRAGLAAYLAWGEARAGHRARAAGGYLTAALRYALQGDRWAIRGAAGNALGVLRGRRYLDSGRTAPSAPLADPPEWLGLYS
jgi:glycosyltransferase involved in cell wall biosynthesis